MPVAESYYYSGQGEVLLGERASDGTPDGLRKVGNVSELSLSFETEKFEHKQSQDGTRSIDLTLLQEISATMSMTLESLDKQNLATVLFGSTSEIASASNKTKTMTVPELGLFMPLDEISLSAVNTVTLDPSGSATTLTEGTDYEVNLKFGLIQFLSGGSAAKGDTVEVDFDHAKYQDIQAITSGSNPQRWMRFNGLNTVDSDNPVAVDVFKGSVQPLSELALINEEIAQLSVEMDVLADNKRSSGSPYFRVKQLS